MRIGFFGNANNYPFMLARALKRLGHEVRFIVDSHERLNRPEFKYSDISFPYPDWISDVSPVRVRDLILPSPRNRRIIKVLRSCDAVVLNGLGPSLSSNLIRPAFLLLTGTDLEGYGNFHSIDAHLPKGNALWTRFWRCIVRSMMMKLMEKQRYGISRASVVSYFARGLVPAGDSLLDELGVTHDRRVFLLMTDLEALEYVPPSSNGTPRVFCATRLTWKKPITPGRSELDYKGSDVMIKGLGAFVRETSTRLDICLVRKGEHIRETEALVVEQGLAPYVTWLSEMSQAEVLDHYRASDIVIEQLDRSVVAMAGLDAMAIGRPVIANARPEILNGYFAEPAPICQASTPEEVCTQLRLLTSSPETRKQIGILSRRYVERGFSSDRAAKICAERLSQFCE